MGPAGGDADSDFFTAGDGVRLHYLRWRSQQSPPSAVVTKMGELLPAPIKWRAFFARQERNPAYLKAGDVITASIAGADGTLDLGTQRTVVRDAPS